MKLKDTEYHLGNGFRGYVMLPEDRFSQLTPYFLRDHDKSLAFMRDLQTVAKLPAWFDQDVDFHEWSGYLIVQAQKEPETA